MAPGNTTVGASAPGGMWHRWVPVGFLPLRMQMRSHDFLSLNRLHDDSRPRGGRLDRAGRSDVIPAARTRTGRRALGHRRVCQDGVPQRRVRQAGRHRDLDGGHDFTGLDPECREAEDAVAPFSISAFRNPRVSESVRARSTGSRGILTRR